jgi:hypothetical protein
MATKWDEFNPNNIEKITNAAADKVEQAKSDGPATPVSDAAPKRRRGRPPGSKNKNGLLPVSEISDGVEQIIGLIGLGVSTFVDPYDGSVLLHSAGPLSKAIADMAAKDKKIHATLTKVIRGGSYASLATAVLPVGMAIAANHGLIPANHFTLMDTGVTPTLYTDAREYQTDDPMSSDFADSENPEPRGTGNPVLDTLNLGV